MRFYTHLERELLNIYQCKKFLGQKQYRNKIYFTSNTIFSVKTKGILADNHSHILYHATVCYAAT
jgi:hypothetical protein